MAGPSSYLASKPLEECWSIPLEQIGCSVERLKNRGEVRRWAIRRASARVTIGLGKDNVLLLVFSSLLSRRGKNVGLAEEVERTLLASGAKVCGEPISTNLVYRVDEQPNRPWLKRVNSAETEVHFSHDAESKQDAAQYPSGDFVAEARSIRFWTGPAIQAETKRLVYYIALDADASNLTGPNPESFLKSLHAALSRSGATRLEVQLKMGALKK